MGNINFKFISQIFPKDRLLKNELINMEIDIIRKKRRRRKWAY